MLLALVSPFFPKSVLYTRSRLYSTSVYTTFLPHVVVWVLFGEAGRNI